MTSSLGAVQERYLAVNGRYPMSEADERYVRDRFRAATDEAVLAAMAAGRLPLPSYLLADGTPMVPEDHGAPAEWAGGLDALQDWFLAHWDDSEQDVARQEWEAYLSGRYVCLNSVTPVNIRRKAELTAQLEAAVAALADDPRGPVALGSLDEAVAGLDRLLAPMTDYDRARFGGPPVRERLVDAPRREHLARTAPALPLRTERVLLRRRRPTDIDDLHAIYSRADVATYLLTPPLSRLELDDRHRRLQESDASFGLVVELDGRVIGDVVLISRGATQAETGWTFHPDVAGKGYATEASRALLDLAFGHFRCHRVYAELDARNAASQRLCERLGMRLEAHRLRDYWAKGEWTDTLQYAVLAEEWHQARR